MGLYQAVGVSFGRCRELVIGTNVQRRREEVRQVRSRPLLVLTLIPRTYVAYIGIKSISVVCLTRRNVTEGMDLDKHPYLRLDLPSAKTARPGEQQSVWLVPQGDLCAISALRNMAEVVPCG